MNRHRSALSGTERHLLEVSHKCCFFSSYISNWSGLYWSLNRRGHWENSGWDNYFIWHGCKSQEADKMLQLHSTFTSLIAALLGLRITASAHGLCLIKSALVFWRLYYFAIPRAFLSTIFCERSIKFSTGKPQISFLGLCNKMSLHVLFFSTA